MTYGHPIALRVASDVVTDIMTAPPVRRTWSRDGSIAKNRYGHGQDQIWAGWRIFESGGDAE